MSTLHCAQENEAGLYVNKRQKIQHFRARSTEERRIKMKNEECKSRFLTSRDALAAPRGSIHGVHGPPFSQKNHYGCTGQCSNKVVLDTH